MANPFAAHGNKKRCRQKQTPGQAHEQARSLAGRSLGDASYTELAGKVTPGCAASVVSDAEPSLELSCSGFRCLE